MTSWACPFDRLLIILMIKSKLLYWARKALYDLATVYYFGAISYYYRFAAGPLAGLTTFGLWRMPFFPLIQLLPLHFVYLISTHPWTSLPAGQINVGKVPRLCLPVAACTPRLVHYQTKDSCKFTCLMSVLFRAIFQHLTHGNNSICLSLFEWRS